MENSYEKIQLTDTTQRLALPGKAIVCFVCGQQKDNLSALLDHMAEAHKQEKEYIVCQQCKYPIRDVQLHYKVHHPYSKMQNGPARVETFYEWDTTRRRLVKQRKKRSKWKEGHFYSEKNQKQLHYRSSWERKVMMVLELSPRVDAYMVEPFCIPYTYNTEKAMYWPDFIIKLKDGTTLMVEVKPQSQTQDPRNQAKWTHALQYCAKNGLVFRVWTEVMIGKLTKLAKKPESLDESVLAV